MLIIKLFKKGLLPMDRVRAIQEEIAGFIDAEVLNKKGEYYTDSNAYE